MGYKSKLSAKKGYMKKQKFFYKILTTLTLVYMFLPYGCSGYDTTTDNSSSAHVDKNNYLITTNGNLDSLSQNKIDAEYNPFFFYQNETRKLYFGGRLPEIHSNYNAVWLENPSIWTSRYIVPILNDDVNENRYYSVLAAPTEIPAIGGNYTVTVNVGKQDITNNTYVPYQTKEVTFKVSNDILDRNWELDVYQQQSYNVFNMTKDEIVRAFKEMNVTFGINESDITLKSSSLPDSVIPHDFNATNVERDSGVIYAFSQIYPGLTTRGAIDQFSQDYPNKGLLFFVQDYRPLNPPDPPIPTILGTTVKGWYGNGIRKQAPISFVYVQSNKNIVTASWQDKEIQTTTVHELGHLWCEGLIDIPEHVLWHNGDNKNQCVMKSNLHIINNIPDNEAQKVLNFRKFCEGHLQRGMNVSWHLKQYSPIGEEVDLQNNYMIASLAGLNQAKNKDLEIELFCEKKEFIQSESIDIIVKLTNNTNESITTYSPKHFLYHIDKDSLTTSQPGHAILSIPPHSSFYYFIEPLSYVMYWEQGGLSLRDWYTGDYEYYISHSVGNNISKSNKIQLKINPVPDSLIEAFNDLKYDPKKTYTIETYEALAQKYKGTPYEREFYDNLLNTDTYRGKFTGDKGKLHKEFVTKYPNNSLSFNIIRSMANNYEENKILIEEILSSIVRDKPESRLIEVLEKQPANIQPQIKQFLKGE